MWNARTSEWVSGSLAASKEIRDILALKRGKKKCFYVSPDWLRQELLHRRLTRGAHRWEALGPIGQKDQIQLVQLECNTVSPSNFQHFYSIIFWKVLIWHSSLYVFQMCNLIHWFFFLNLPLALNHQNSPTVKVQLSHRSYRQTTLSVRRHFQ